MSLRFNSAAIFIIAFLLAISPNLIRGSLYGIDEIPGLPTYMHQRISEYMAAGTFNWHDPLSYGGRAYTYPPLFSIFLAASSIMFGVGAGGIIFMGFLAALAAVSIFLIAKELKIDERVAALFLILSPGFIYLFFHLSTRSPGIAFGLFGGYLLLKNHRLAPVPLALGSLFHPESAVIIISSLAGWYAISKDKKILRTAIITFAVAAVFFGAYLLANGIPQYSGIYDEYTDRKLSLEPAGQEAVFWELGYGKITILLYALAVLGILFTKGYALKIFFLASAILPLTAERFTIYMIFPAVLLAAKLFTNNRKKMVKPLLVACMLYMAISTVMYINASATSWPSRSQIDAMKWIRDNTPENGTVLSDWSEGHWISGIAYRKNYMDGYAEYAPDVNAKLSKLHEFYNSCDPPEGIQYAIFEEWFIEQSISKCIYNYPIVYNNSGIYVFELLPS